MAEIPDGFTETGYQVYLRTYSRLKEDGSRENWSETAQRVVDGNLALTPEQYNLLPNEREDLLRLITSHKIVPAGRQLYMSGVQGRQFLFNCHVSGWTDKLSDHFAFTFLRLMEGGGVGANYSTRYLKDYSIWRPVRVRMYCSIDHPDYGELEPYLDAEPAGRIPKIIPDSREGWALALSSVIDSCSVWNFNKHEECRWVDFVPDDEGIQDTAYIYLDLSAVRPSGSPINTFGGTAAGPVPLAKMLKRVEELLNSAWLECGMHPQYAMAIDHAIAECVISGNVRRSARMSIMRWDDPQIFWFLSCKTDTKDNWSTNISVEIDDDFVRLVNTDPDFDAPMDYSVPDGFHERLGMAHDVYQRICEGMLENGEPGFWDSSLANIGESNPVTATNPCGEIALEGFENCNLGHVNLAMFVNRDGYVDWDDLCLAHRLMSRFLVRATFGDITDDKQREIVSRNRRIGVGHLGYQWFVNKQGIKYSESHANERVRSFLRACKKNVREAARDLAFQLRIPEPIKVTCVAPTGSISMMSGVTPGIQPIIFKYFIRRVRFSAVDPDQLAQVEDYRQKGHLVTKDIYSANTLVVEIPSKDPLIDNVEDVYVVEEASDISLEDMLRVQKMYQTNYADNAVSFTANLSQDHLDSLGSTPDRRVSSLCVALRPFLGTLKGTTIMVSGSRPQAPFERLSEDDYWEYAEFLRVTQDTSYDGCSTGACPVR